MSSYQLDLLVNEAEALARLADDRDAIEAHRTLLLDLTALEAAVEAVTDLQDAARLYCHAEVLLAQAETLAAQTRLAGVDRRRA